MYQDNVTYQHVTRSRRLQNIDALKSAMNAHQLNKSNMNRKDVSDGVKKAFNVLHDHLPDWVSTTISEDEEELTITIKIPKEHD